MQLAFFYPFGKTDYESCMFHHYSGISYKQVAKEIVCLMYDQEPLLVDNVTHFFEESDNKTPDYIPLTNFLHVLGNSEISKFKTEICEKYNLIDFYYFFHGFLSLYWFNDAKYFKHLNQPIQKDFLTMNHLCTKDRSYRLTLIAELIEHNILEKGNVSLHIFNNENNQLSEELFSPGSRLSPNAKKLIYKNITPLTKNLVLDQEQGYGQMSADFDHDVYKLWQSSFFHIVTETVFYYDKLHLTEKIFKPVVARRPFILCGAPGNLAYLKSYGFKTFDKWIDESYDNEKDNDLRIKKIVIEIKKITEMSPADKEIMYKEMTEVLEYNFNHFFYEFKEIIVNELLENFETCLTKLKSKHTGEPVAQTIDFSLVKKALLP